jgi:hypothetical protein
MSVELDAIEPGTLREMVDQVLESYLPPGAIETKEAQEAADREQIRQWIQEHWRP